MKFIVQSQLDRVRVNDVDGNALIKELEAFGFKLKEPVKEDATSLLGRKGSTRTYRYLESQEIEIELGSVQELLDLAIANGVILIYGQGGENKWELFNDPYAFAS